VILGELMADNLLYYGDNPPELLGGKRIEDPPSRRVDGSFRTAPKAREVAVTTPELPWQ